jgi:hypothetical protein
MKALKLVICTLTLTASFANAAENIFCAKGNNQAEQNRKFAYCEELKGEKQTCETNLWKHGAGAFDVCLQNIEGADTDGQCFKSFNENDQMRKKDLCEALKQPEQICETNIFQNTNAGHNAGVYDVCILLPANK